MTNKVDQLRLEPTSVVVLAQISRQADLDIRHGAWLRLVAPAQVALNENIRNPVAQQLVPDPHWVHTWANWWTG